MEDEASVGTNQKVTITITRLKRNQMGSDYEISCFMFRIGFVFYLTNFKVHKNETWICRMNINSSSVSFFFTFQRGRHYGWSVVCTLLEHTFPILFNNGYSEARKIQPVKWNVCEIFLGTSCWLTLHEWVGSWVRAGSSRRLVLGKVDGCSQVVILTLQGIYLPLQAQDQGLSWILQVEMSLCTKWSHMTGRLPEPSESKIWSWVPWDSEPRITVLARARSNLLDCTAGIGLVSSESLPSRGEVACSSGTNPLVEEEAPFQNTAIT
jgi:hypothetical protein